MVTVRSYAKIRREGRIDPPLFQAYWGGVQDLECEGKRLRKRLRQEISMGRRRRIKALTKKRGKQQKHPGGPLLRILMG